MDYFAPINGDQENPNRPYVNANPGAGIEGSWPHAKAIEGSMREINNVILHAGLALNGADFTQLKTAIVTLIAGVSLTPPTYQYLKTGAAATYNRPAGCKAIRVRMVGGGGGGGDSGGSTASAGGDTSFNSIVAKGGSAGPAHSGAARPAAAGAGTGSALLRISGQRGDLGAVQSPGNGGNSFFGGAGVGNYAATATAAAANSGSGGGGGYVSNTSVISAGGGDAGEYVEFIILNPSATYTYTVGAGGNGGGLGSSNTAGAAGGSGLIIVEEFY